MEFKEELKKYASIVNQELEKHIIKDECPEGMLNASMEYSLISSGKRIRPTLMLATYRLFKEDYESAFSYAVAMEMIHNFSLIHDDLPGIDNDDFRHGKPTNHKKFNEATAILAGDGLLNRAYMVISKDIECSSDENMRTRRIRCLVEFSKAVDRMIAGEYVDTEFEGKEISNEYLEYMHKNKTGALIRVSARIGGILAEASENDLENITKYAENIGLAFQIKDDILSEIGDEKILGKPVGNDRKRGKITFITKYGIEEAKNKLETTIDNAIAELDIFGEKAKFLKELAIYIRDRES